MSLHAVSLIRCTNEALKKLHLKAPLSASKKSENMQVTRNTISISPIDCCVRIMVYQIVYSVVIFSHRYLDRDHINFKTFVFLAV